MASIGKLQPAVPIEESVFHGHILCLECGLPFKVLKRHLQCDHGLNIEAYRQRFGLPPSYPLVAPGYAETRAALAKATTRHRA
jgi:predicted transcriptional regulator